MMKTQLPGPANGGWFGWNFGVRLRKDILGFVEELSRDHADLAYFRTGPIDNVVITSPALIHEALAARAKEFPKHERALRLLSRLDGQAITVAQDAPWRRQRRLVQPAFHAGRLCGYADVVVAATRNALARWRDGGPIELAEEMTRLALEVITRALFGTDVADQTQALGRAVQDFSEVLRWEVGSPLTLPDWLPFPSKRRKRRAVRKVHDFIEGVIRQRRAAPAERDDLLAMLLQARDEEGGGLTDRQVRDEAVALFRGGFDTTAAGLTWAFHLLATHPDVADRASAEADGVLGERPAAIADLPRLPYTSMVVKESLRLYPPVWALFGRWAPVETALGDYRIPKGAWLHVFPWGQHRSPRLFRDPLRFDPERFSPERSAEIVPHAYVPFGLGPHVCIGKEFALMQMSLTVATVLQQVRLVPPEGRGAVVPEAAIAVRPKDGLRLVVTRRPPPAAGA